MSLENAIKKFVDEMTEPHLTMIKVWGELKENIPEEDKPRYEDLWEEFGYLILEMGKMPGKLIQYYNMTNNEHHFDEELQ